MSDRMLSRDKKRHAAQTSKLYQLHTNVALLYAGAMHLTDGIVSAMSGPLMQRWPPGQVARPSVLEAAHIYRRAYERERKAQALSLRQSASSYDFPIDIAPVVIIAGHDATGPHIYTIWYGERESHHDKAGFASIGSTSDRADGVLHDWHSPTYSYGSALMTAYVAKRRGESRRLGVGMTTDIYTLQPNPPRGRVENADIGKWLRLAYNQLVKRHKLDKWFIVQYGDGAFLEGDTGIMLHGLGTLPQPARPLPPETKHGQ